MNEEDKTVAVVVPSVHSDAEYIVVGGGEITVQTADDELFRVLIACLLYTSDAADE